MDRSAIVPDSDLHSFLEKIPLFSSIPRDQLHAIAELCVPLSAQKGDIVFREGEPGDSMYIVKSGSVGVYVGNGNSERFVSYLLRGDFFGEMALLTGRSRSATIRTILDAHLYQIQRQAFDQLLEKNPHLGLYLSRHYAHRFAQSSRQALDEPLPTFFAMIATHEGLGESHFLYTLAYHLADEADKRVLVVELYPGVQKRIAGYGLNETTCPDPELTEPFSSPYAEILHKAWFSHPCGFMAFVMPRIKERQYWNEFEGNLPHVMSLLRKHFDLVFFSIPTSFGVLGQGALRLCDRLLILMNNTEEAISEVREKIRAILIAGDSQLAKVKAGVSHLIGEQGVPRDQLGAELGLAETPSIWVDRKDAGFFDRIDVQKRFPVRGPRALARELGRIRVGLALGAGGARGWAHLGVLKVLEEEGIHIDMISGASMGAVVGSVYARTASTRRTKELTISLVPTKIQVQRRMFDYTIPLRGIIRGQKIVRLLRNALKDADFLDLLIPTFVVAVDILTGEEVLLEKGRVHEAVRASISIPGIFNPFCLDGRWLVDGGLLQPVPVDVLIQKGADIVIAVCVERESYRQSEGVAGPPTIVGQLSRTVNIMHTQATKEFAKKADIVLYPKVAAIGWDEFHRGNALMRAGEEACRESLAEIRRLIEEKAG